MGTDWEITGINPGDFIARTGGALGNAGYRNALYEITFQGALHDVQVSVPAAANGLPNPYTFSNNDGTLDDDAGKRSSPFDTEWARAEPVFTGGLVSSTIWVLAPAPEVLSGSQAGMSGTSQGLSSIGMEPDGDFTTLYTQQETLHRRHDGELEHLLPQLRREDRHGRPARCRLERRVGQPNHRERVNPTFRPVRGPDVRRRHAGGKSQR